MRVLFAGTPAVALPALDGLLAGPHQVVGVLSRPDAPAGRGRHYAASPVAERAARAGVPVLRPHRLLDPHVHATIAALAPDCAAVVAYGALVPLALLDLVPHGWINLHFSLLPAWRGAAPVQHCLLAGDDVAGATTFRMVEELDAGPVLGTLTEQVRPRDTAGDLLDRLAEAGAALLAATVDGLTAGRLHPRPQTADGVTYAPRLSVDDGRMRWAAPAIAVDRRARACSPEPGAWTTMDGVRVKIGPVLPTDDLRQADHERFEDAPRGLAPGQLLVQRHRVLVGTGTAPVELGGVQPPGRRLAPAADWARGARLPASARMGT